MPRLRVADLANEERIAYDTLLAQEIWRAHIRREAERIVKNHIPADWGQAAAASREDAEESDLFPYVRGIDIESA